MPSCSLIKTKLCEVMHLLLFSLAVVHCLIATTLAGVQDARYQATCTFGGPNDVRFQHDCHVALFSFKPIDFSGKVVATENNFCTPQIADNAHVNFIKSQNLAVMVKRGNCAFSTKALHAQQAGFQLVIIANSEEEGFPVGPPELDFKLDVPVAMVGQKVWDQVYETNVDQALMILRDASKTIDESGLLAVLDGCHTVALHFDQPASQKAPPTSDTQTSNSNSDKRQTHPTIVYNVQLVRVLFVGAAVVSALVLVVVFYSTLQTHFQQQQLLTPKLSISATTMITNNQVATTSYTTYLIQALVYTLIVIVFIATRLGTLRVYSTTNPLNSSEVVYNHRETDERVFEALLHNVLSDPLDYRLHPHTIQELHLAEENYSDSIFIHPPLFVYLSAMLRRFCGLPIPLIPILLQTMALGLLPIVCRYVMYMVNHLYSVLDSTGCAKDRRNTREYYSENDNFSVGVWSMLILCCCPIAAFSSQKFWIDNCLLWSVTVCVTSHVVLLHYTTTSGKDSTNGMFSIDSVWRHAMSGVIFGLVGLNCKITAAALLLFLVGWSFLQQYLLHQTSYKLLVGSSQDTSSDGDNIVVIMKKQHRSNSARNKKYTLLLRQAVSAAVVNCTVFGLCALLAYAPWMYIYWIHTGRLTPNAWPSATMLQRSSFVRAAVNKPWYSYVYTLVSVAPVHLIGSLCAVVVAVCSVPGVVSSVVYGASMFCGGQRDNTENVGGDGDNTDKSNDNTHTSACSNNANTTFVNGDSPAAAPLQDRRASLRRRSKATAAPTVPATTAASNSDAVTLIVDDPIHRGDSHPPLPYVVGVDPFALTLLVFSLWPLGFLVGLTVLGSAGSGFQSRFLMPMLPGSAILAAFCIHWVQRTFSTVPNSVLSSACCVVMGVVMMYSTMHVLYYGVLYAPLFADLDVNLVDILCSILQSVYSAPTSRDEFRATLRFMSHYGLVRETS